MRILIFATAVALLALGGACASPFKRVYPGMTEAQVSAVMEQAPSRTDLFEGDYSAWYYGEDHCLLLHEGLVVAKQQTEETAQVHSPLGSVRQKTLAQCLPPGVSRPERKEHEIDIHLPGGGGIHHEQKQPPSPKN